MSTIHETIHILEEFNKWRRGDHTITAPCSFELGVAIGDAVRLLREHVVIKLEVERLKGLASWANTCIHHNDAERARYGHVCPVCTSTRAEKAEADTARLDWLDENMGYSGGGSGGTYTFFTPADVECGMLRDAIDAAMKDISK